MIWLSKEIGSIIFLWITRLEVLCTYAHFLMKAKLHALLVSLELLIKRPNLLLSRKKGGTKSYWSMNRENSISWQCAMKFEKKVGVFKGSIGLNKKFFQRVYPIVQWWTFFAYSLLLHKPLFLPWEFRDLIIKRFEKMIVEKLS